MPNVSVEGETGKVELASNGIIKTEAATQERLVLTKMAGIFAARLASGWLPFEYTVAEFENGTRLPVNIRLGLSL